MLDQGDPVQSNIAKACRLPAAEPAWHAPKGTDADALNNVRARQRCQRSAAHRFKAEGTDSLKRELDAAPIIAADFQHDDMLLLGLPFRQRSCHRGTWLHQREGCTLGLGRLLQPAPIAFKAVGSHTELSQATTGLAWTCQRHDSNQCSNH